MSIRTLAHVAVIGAGTLAAVVLLAPPAAACDTAQCFVEPQVTAEPPAQSETQSQPAGAPLQLRKFQRRPVASTAARAVKTRDGGYAQVSHTRRTKPQPAAVEAKPADLPADAAQAFALHAAAQVRVVSPDEVNEIDLAADAPPEVTTKVEVLNAVAVVGSEELNEIDRKADAPRAVSLDALNRNLPSAAATPDEPADDASWFARMLAVLGGAFAAAAAAARMLIG
jgi:hypothetical protein